MRGLPMALIAVLLLSLPAAGAEAPAAKDNAKKLANEMKQAATPSAVLTSPTEKNPSDSGQAPKSGWLTATPSGRR